MSDAPEEPLTDEDRAHIRELLIEAGFSMKVNQYTGQSEVEWMSASCPSIARCREVCREKEAKR